MHGGRGTHQKPYIRCACSQPARDRCFMCEIHRDDGIPTSPICVAAIIHEPNGTFYTFTVHSSWPAYLPSQRNTS